MEFLIDFVKPEVIAQNKDVKNLKKQTFMLQKTNYQKR